MSEGEDHQVPLPEYRPASFHALWKLLGESDSSLEWLEVAVRELLRQHRDDGTPAATALAQRHAVKVNDLNVDALKSHWARLQITTVAQYLELFLDNYRVEIPRQVRSRSNKEDLVTYTLDVFKAKKASVGELQCGLVDYYRKVRNHLVHDPAAEDPKMLTRQAEELRKVIETTSTPYRSLVAPNPPAAVSFDDFVLFSRALKDFSKGLCSSVFLTDEELRAKILANCSLLSSLRKQNASERQRKILANYVRQHFGFRLRAEAIAEGFLHEGLLAQR